MMAVTLPLGAPGMAMPDWIRQVIDYRRTAQSAPDAIQRGIWESIRAGTTTLGEIAQPRWRTECLADAPLDAVVFLELLTLAPERVEAKLDEARQHLATSPVTGTETRATVPDDSSRGCWNDTGIVISSCNSRVPFYAHSSLTATDRRAAPYGITVPFGRAPAETIAPVQARDRPKSGPFHRCLPTQ
jgi:hypothetical protein